MPRESTRTGGIAVHNALLTASKPELLDKDGDRTLRALLYNFFAFGRSLEAARAKFASFAGLSPTQYLILIAITHFRSDEPMGINQLADWLHLSGAFVTNEVNKLVSDGLIEKNAHPSDGRRVQLAVTEQGVSRLARLAALQRPINDALFGMLTREEFKLLSQLLARLAANGDLALKLAEHLEAAMGLEQHLDAGSVAKAPKRLKSGAAAVGPSRKSKAALRP
ncbi:winged helix-turn-helix transcriptional regulator [Bradyrhizobium sp. KBS0727]|nr:winged helix-turn-helix transcriptional regulator [Bradyrhizobium sp. KBS0725]QDW48546.1 winged helix-turn-helix transcriptional regulator [Bradyrhizobium sp. KBS0727]